MTEQIITKEKQGAVTLRWLQMATNAKKRNWGKRGEYKKPALSGLHIKNGVTESADGYRAHLAPTPEPLSELDEDTIIRIREGKGLHKSAGRVYPAEKVEATFPSIEQCFPIEDPQAVVAVKAKYLKEALEMPNDGPGGMVILTIYRSYSPLLVESYDGECKALIMSMTAPDEHKYAGKEADKRKRIVEKLENRYPDIYEELSKVLS